MPRWFRIYGKKRGDRRTGSPALGNAGEALFSGFFFLLGCAALVLLMARVIVPEWRANHDFIETTCTVLDARLESTAGDQQFRPAVRIRYSDGEETFDVWCYDIVRAFSSSRESNQALVDQFLPGEKYTCWYDSKWHGQVVLVRGYSGWLWAVMLVPLAFIGIGAAGLVHSILLWGKSAEHRAVAARRAANLMRFDTPPSAQDFPGIPSDANITNSPGMRLKYRLPINISQGWRLFGLATVCVVWNGLVMAFALPMLQGRSQGLGQWLFVLPFFCAGMALIAYFGRQFLIANGVGATLLELSDHPLLPGQTYSALISQAGHVSVVSLSIDLVCEEEATYRQGTDTRTDHRRVFQQQIFRREHFEIEPARPFEEQLQVTIPSRAMHSFKTDHNEVQWKLIVKGEVERWSDFERSFPVIVYPPVLDAKTAIA